MFATTYSNHLGEFVQNSLKRADPPDVAQAVTDATLLFRVGRAPEKFDNAELYSEAVAAMWLDSLEGEA